MVWGSNFPPGNCALSRVSKRFLHRPIFSGFIINVGVKYTLNRPELHQAYKVI
jgi:hypothetical protein